jgi:hypothetical protein
VAFDVAANLIAAPPVALIASDVDFWNKAATAVLAAVVMPAFAEARPA